MAAVDTNVLVRFLVQDDAAQSAIAKRLIQQSLEQARTLFVPITVALELEWVLRASFGFAKADVVDTLTGLLSCDPLTFESESALEFALSFYKKGTADFADCVHAALCVQAGEAPLWTFDKRAAKITGTALLTP